MTPPALSPFLPSSCALVLAVAASLSSNVEAAGSIPNVAAPGRDTCTACHTVTPNLSAHSPREIHALHAGDLARPEGDCLQCHEDDGRFLVARANACSGCHADFAKKAPHDAKKLSDSACASCHSPETVRSAHLGAKEKTAREGLKSLVSVDLTDAKIVRDAGKPYAEVTFRLLDAEGRPVPLATKDPADAPWIKNLQLYVNWDAESDFTSSRGTPIYVKSNKRDVTQKGLGRTPAGERERTPLFRTDGEHFTYRVGPVVLEDRFSTSEPKIGVVSNRLIYCFDDAKRLTACDGGADRKNAAWNDLWVFDEKGLVSHERLTALRPTITSNAKCGTCHGYNAEQDETEINCRSCHSQVTRKNKHYADTTCYSGHDDENGRHATPFKAKSYAPRPMPGFGGSTNDLTLPCVTCHNPNTPPTAAIRDYMTNADSPDFVDDLVLSHPDMKVWIHSLHAGTRPSQRAEGGVREVKWAKSRGDCTACHEGESYGLERLAEIGRPLALDTAYNPDSNAHPAVDFKVNAYASPMAATCFACHAYTRDSYGKAVKNAKAKAHITEMGGKFGVKLEELQPERCNTCHTPEALGKAHGLKR